jgi:small-conductance mechanosensitive channel
MIRAAVAWGRMPAVAGPGSFASERARRSEGHGMRIRANLLKFVLALFLAGAAVAAEPPKTPSATLTILNREVVTFRGTVAELTPSMRVQNARVRIRAIPARAFDDQLLIVPTQVGAVRGVQFFLGPRLLFSVLEDDVDPEASQSFDELVAQTRERVEGVRAAWHRAQDWPLLLHGVLVAAIGTVVALLLGWLTYRGGGVAMNRLEQWRDRMAARHGHVDFGEFLARVVVGSMHVVLWFAIAGLLYAWVRFLLGTFVATEPLAADLDAWLWDKLRWLLEGFVDGLPGLITIVIVLVVTRAIADAVGYLFDAVQHGRLKVPMVHPETTTATRRIIGIVVWGLGLAVAYPYLPGSGSDAFKGLSVLFGLMLTLGSTSLVAQAMSGLVIVYSRALRRGDFVEIGEVQGVVTEVATLATKVVNVRNEEITIPNSVLIASPIRNYSKVASGQGTLLSAKVTIGYDAPWRQVHALLIEAARKTRSVRAEPAPFVYQRALFDFYVEYELFVSIDRPLERIPILSDLLAHIQDEFNAHGVQIMSPHFFAQPAQPVVVPREHWHAAPASPSS